MFSKKELLRLNDALVSLHAAPDLTTWAERSIDLIRQVIEGDFHSVAVCENQYSHAVGVWEPNHVPLGDYGEVFATIQRHHPLYTGWRRVGSHEKAMRISDCIEQSSWRENPIYRDVFRPLRFKNQVGVWGELGIGGHLELSCIRTGRDFIKRDRNRLGFVRPHITQAYLNWRRSAELRGLPPAPVMLLQQTRLASARLQESEGSASSMDGSEHFFGRLTVKEREVVVWVGQGKANPQIATMLGISPRTVQKHLEHVFQKLGVKTRLEAAMRLRELGAPNSKG